jgi:hypothetical protein
MRRTPPIAARGIYQLRQPWAIPASKVYTCYAIRTFKDIYELGEDVYTRYYEPYGVTRGDFANDEGETAAIITLISDDFDVVYVPDTYIAAYPDMGIVNYQRVVLSLDFGMLPDFLDLEFIKQEMATVGTKVIGKEPDVNEAVAPTSGAITPQEHQVLEASRLANIEFQDTDYSKYLEQVRLNNDLSERIRTLEQIIIDNGLLDPPQ